MIKNIFIILLFLFSSFELVYCQTNSSHVKVSGYTRKDGSYVQPYFRTAPNSTNRDNFSTKGNVNPYTHKPGWIEPDGKYNTFYYNTYTYSPSTTKSLNETNSSPPIKYKNRTYIEDEHGTYNYYLTIKDERTFNIFNMNDDLIMYLVINHRGDWRIFDENMIYIKTIFVKSEI
jgi:hypothetical protein